MSFISEEGRQGRRIQASVPAWLEPQPGNLFPCTVENIGHGGDQLVVNPDIAYPSRFMIRLTADGKVRRACRIVWQKNDRIGVRFVRTDGSSHKQP
jgi:hypothetical protein